MPARSIAAPTIAFGHVSIPVKLYTTGGRTDPGIKFAQLHDADSGRLQQKFVCTTCNEFVDQDHTIRGYELANGQHVVITPDELKAIDAVALQTIQLEHYVQASTIDPVYIEKVFWVGPDKKGEKAFRLLWTALVETGLVAVGTYSANRRQTLVSLRPVGDLLAMHQLRSPHEVLPVAEVPPSKFPQLTSVEVDLAKSLVMDGARETFPPEEFRDEVQERIRALVDQKVEGTPIEAPPIVKPGNLVDLVEALKLSVKPKS